MKATSADASPSSPRLVRLLFTILISLTTLAFGGCDREGRSGRSDTAKKTEAAPAEVGAVTIAPKTLPVTFEAVGQTEGSREVEVRARVGGILLRRFYQEGEWLKRGAQLFKIDPAPYEAALNRLKGAILGVLPLALSTGAGAASRQSIGTGVIGGMLAATFIAVLFIPLFYVLLTSRKEPRTANEPDSGPAHAEPVKGSGS
jgi:AcrB/AcrD/AcrF family